MSDDDAERREAATAELRHIGEPAWPYLEPHLKSNDLELALRVGLLAPDLATVPADQCARVQELLRQLETTPDELLRAKAVDGLLSLGPGALRKLRQCLSGADSVPVVEVSLERRLVLPGQSIQGKAVLRNKGHSPFWVAKVGTHLAWWLTGPEPFGEKRPLFGPRLNGGGRRLMVKSSQKGYYHPIRDWRPVPGGATDVELAIESILDFVGVYHGKACFLWGFRKEVIQSWVPFAADPLPDLPPNLRRETDKDGNIFFEWDGALYREFAVRDGPSIVKKLPFEPQFIALKINQCLSDKDLAPAQEETLFALPNFDAKDTAALARIALSGQEPIRGTAGGKANVMIALLSLQQDKRLCLESGLERFAWYALLDEKGVPVQWGSWRSVLENPESYQEQGKSLEPAGRADWKLALPLPEKAGAYSLVAGYDVPAPGKESGEQEEPRVLFARNQAESHGVPMETKAAPLDANAIPLADTRICARLGTVRVDAKP